MAADSESRSRQQLVAVIFGFSLILRSLVGYHPHSGQDNYEGSRVAYGGDFEAQRHWMELTWHLPIGEWYWHDLEYWGLDYPPLTAYVSYVCGMVSHFVVGPETVALYESRGIEDPVHKAYMRLTVIVLDLLFYGLAVWYAAVDRSTEDRERSSLWTVILALSQPAIVLIDHGHFQYNTVALGLSIAAFSQMVQPDFRNCVVGSIFFCMALSFKQMTLYYAPAVFFYLLGRCFSSPAKFLARFTALGTTVIACFLAMWAPVIYYGPQDTTHMERLLHVIHRIFPFQRGLFEGKVANLWCTLSTRPLSIRERVSPELLPSLALLATLMLITPACVRMFQLGLESRSTSGDTKGRTQQHWILLLWATMSSALAFFLASFQVHEKSILLALAPCSLLLWQDPTFVDWFSFVSCWTLWPLLQTDRLQTPYVCTMLIFWAIIYIRKEATGQVTSAFSGIPWEWIPWVSSLGMCFLHLVELVVPVPSHLPDLFEVLWSLAGCGMFCIAWSLTCVNLFKSRTNDVWMTKPAAPVDKKIKTT